MTRALFRIVLVVALLGAVVFAGLYLTRLSVTVAPVKRGTAASAVPGTVTVRAERTYPVVTEIPGRIAKNDLEVGQQVKAGDLLVQIDGRALEIEIRQTRGQLAAVNRRLELGSTRKFELEGAKQLLVFREQLLDGNAISPADVEAQRRAVRALEQLIELDVTALELEKSNLEAALDTRESALAKTTLRSPIDGLVSRVEAFEGDLVNSGTLIAEVVSLTRIVDAKVSEENNAYVQVGQPATVRLAGYGDQKFAAKVSKLATTADPETQRYVVELQVTAEVEKLVPGMTGEAVITVNERPDALLVPRPSLVGSHVYVIDDGRVEVRTVTVGFTALNEAEIREGLAEGEYVAVDQFDLLRDGSRVRVAEAR